jgi:hypothetical protein
MEKPEKIFIRELLERNFQNNIKSLIEVLYK